MTFLHLVCDEKRSKEGRKEIGGTAFSRVMQQGQSNQEEEELGASGNEKTSVGSGKSEQKMSHKGLGGRVI